MNSLTPSLPLHSARGRKNESVWRSFLARHSRQLLRVARYHALDEDQAQDCFLYLCEKLWDNDCKRLRQFEPDRGVPFEGWLNAVANNLCHDWRRSENGRPRPPKAILDLDPLAQRAYQLRYVGHLELPACLETLRQIEPELDANDLSKVLARVHQALSAKQRWRVDILNRRPKRRHLSLQAGHVMLPARSATEPDRQAEDQQRRQQLRTALTQLNATDRLMLRLRFEEMLPLAEVARLLGLNNLHQARRRIETALAHLRNYLPKA